MNESTHGILPQETRTKIELLNAVRAQIGTVIVGQKEVVDLTLLALLMEGHVLLEGVPGLGKTLLVRTLAESLSLDFSRIQFTPDLMPADIIGATVISQEERQNFRLEFEKGPVFTNILLADEINRASPKTQSALLEAMQERAVTVRGTRYQVNRPFQVLATQNPLEMEGTYPLPEAQTDRFAFKILISHPSEEELVDIVEQTVGPERAPHGSLMSREDVIYLQRAVREVIVPRSIASYAARLTTATLPERDHAPKKVRDFVRYGSGPRGAQMLVLAAKARALADGRFHASIQDVRSCIEPVLRHRIALNFDGQTEGVSVESILDDVRTSVDTARDWAESIKAE